MLTPYHLANTLLEIGCQTYVPVTPAKLHSLMYLIVEQYADQTGKLLFTEKFSMTAKGVRLPSISAKFDCFCDMPITTFAKDAKGNASAINLNSNKTLRNIIYDIWSQYSKTDSAELILLIVKKTNR